jgi:hypothetical protein
MAPAIPPITAAAATDSPTPSKISSTVFNILIIAFSYSEVIFCTFSISLNYFSSFLHFDLNFA